MATGGEIASKKHEEALNKTIKILTGTDEPKSVAMLVGEMNAAPTTLYRYLKVIPSRLSEDQELIKTKTKFGTTGFIIKDKKDRYKSDKTESGYPDPTAQMAIASQLHSRPAYVPGYVWLVTNSDGSADPWLVLSLNNFMRNDNAVVTCRAYDKSDLNNHKFEPATPGIVKIGEDLWADTCMICTKKAKWFTKDRVAKVEPDRFKIVMDRITEQLDGISSYSNLEATIKMLEKTLDDRNKEVANLKDKVNQLKAKLDKKIKEKEACQSIIRDLHSALKSKTEQETSDTPAYKAPWPNHASGFKPDEYLKGKVDAYELVLNKLSHVKVIFGSEKGGDDDITRLDPGARSDIRSSTSVEETA